MKASAKIGSWLWLLAVLASAPALAHCGSSDDSSGGTGGTGGLAGSSAGATSPGGANGEAGESAAGAPATSGGSGNIGAGGASTGGADSAAGMAGAAPGGLELSALSLKFDVECPHAPVADPQTLTITNKSDSAATWTATYDATAVAVMPAGSTLAAGDHVDVQVAPAAITTTKVAGSAVTLGSITVTSDLPGQTDQVVALAETASGYFVQPGADPNLGLVFVSAEGSTKVAAIAGVPDISLTSSNPDFILSSATPSAGDGTWGLTFIPTLAGLESTTLTVSSTTSCIWPPNTLEATGTGIYDGGCTMLGDGSPCATDGVCEQVCTLNVDLSGSPVAATSATPFDGEVAVGTLELAPLPTLTATIDWGDGTTTAGTATVDAGLVSVSGTHTYTGVGPHTGTVTITDSANGLKTKTTFAVVVGS